MVGDLMKTTIRLDDDLYFEVRQLAAESGRTLSTVIEDSLRVTLARNRPDERLSLNLTTFQGSGLIPGVNLDRSAALLDQMEAPNGRS